MLSSGKHSYHIVWTTKGRGTADPSREIELRRTFYVYFSWFSKAAEMGVFVYAINGMADLFGHIVVAIPIA